MQDLLLSAYEAYQLGFSTLMNLLAPLGHGWALVLISIALGIILVLIYGQISAQNSIAAVKKRITANILESVLFRHDIGVSLSAQLRAMMLSFQYASLAIPPLIILAIPTLLVLGQMYPMFGLRGAEVGDEIVITAKLNSEDAVEALSLSVPEETSDPVTVSVPHLAEKTWRIQVDETHQAPKKVILSVEEQGTLSIPLLDSGEKEVSGADSLSLAWLTGSVAIPESLEEVIDYVSITYPERAVSWLGISWNWIILFFIISLCSGLVVSRFASIEI